MLLHRCGLECEGKNHSDSVEAMKMEKIDKMNNGAKPQCVMSAVNALQRHAMAMKGYDASVESTQRDVWKNHEIGGTRKARIVGIVVVGKKICGCGSVRTGFDSGSLTMFQTLLHKVWRDSMANRDMEMYNNSCLWKDMM